MVELVGGFIILISVGAIINDFTSPIESTDYDEENEKIYSKYKIKDELKAYKNVKPDSTVVYDGHTYKHVGVNSDGTHDVYSHKATGAVYMRPIQWR